MRAILDGRSGDDPRDGERIDLGPDDYLQESAQDWATLALEAGGLGGAGAKVTVDYMKVKLERDRLDFDRRQHEDAQRLQGQPDDDY